MSMQVETLAIQELKLITPAIFRDERGFFSETYKRQAFAEAGVAHEFVQDNQSLSRAKGVLRGLHFQIAPHPQSKLVRVTRGAIFRCRRRYPPRLADLWASCLCSAVG